MNEEMQICKKFAFLETQIVFSQIFLQKKNVEIYSCIVPAILFNLRWKFICNIHWVQEALNRNREFDLLP